MDREAADQAVDAWNEPSRLPSTSSRAMQPEVAPQMPPTTILPSGWIANEVAIGPGPLTRVVPPKPNVGSTTISALNRVTRIVDPVEVSASGPATAPCHLIGRRRIGLRR